MWPSLLMNHKCSMWNKIGENGEVTGLDISNLNYDENCQEDIPIEVESELDFEIPAPIVELTEYENNLDINERNCDNNAILNIVNNNERIIPYSNNINLIVQEVPIEFV